MMTMPFSWHHLNHWDISALPMLLLVGAGALYYWGVKRSPTPWARSRSICFVAGLVVTFLATQTFIGVYDMEYQPTTPRMPMRGHSIE